MFERIIRRPPPYELMAAAQPAALLLLIYHLKAHNMTFHRKGISKNKSNNMIFFSSPLLRPINSLPCAAADTTIFGYLQGENHS